jgi:hypothetical protein
LTGIARQEAKADGDHTIDTNKDHDIGIMAYSGNTSCNPRKKNDKYGKDDYG